MTLRIITPRPCTDELHPVRERAGLPFDELREFVAVLWDEVWWHQLPFYRRWWYMLQGFRSPIQQFYDKRPKVG